MNIQNSVLVLGATGGIGSEVARQLLAKGWIVKALTRQSQPRANGLENITWIQGDAMQREDVVRAAVGCSVIVHAVNPPAYRNWGKLVLPMLDNTLAAARQYHATVVLPGTLYNFGPDAGSLLNESSEQNPLTRKGAIRVQMEQRLRQYAHQGGQVIVARAGDFFGPGAVNNWFSQGLIKPGRSVSFVANPGKTGIGHQWAYLPDVAQNLVTLIQQRQQLEPFSCFHLGGHWDNDGSQMVNAICLAVQKHTGKKPWVLSFPWWLVTLLSPFQETMRELLEMRYLWQRPVRLNNEKITRLLGQEAMTPLDVAVEETLKSLGCLPQSR